MFMEKKECASTAWDPHLVKDVKPCESIQRQATRFVKNDYTIETRNVTRLLHSLNWLTLEAQRKCHRLDLFHNLVNGSVAISTPTCLNVPTHAYNAKHGLGVINVELTVHSKFYTSDLFLDAK